MPLQSINPTTVPTWKKLEAHFESMQHASMKEMFATDPGRARKFQIQWQDFLIDYSKNIVSEETISTLLSLAQECRLQDAISKYFSGDIINQTERRAVLHMALRAPQSECILVDGENIIPEIYSVRNKIRAFTAEVISGQRQGFTGKPFTDVVNIGIGGSDLGPDMVVHALQFYKNHLNTHFISNVDGDHVHEILKNLDLETTLFVIASKTFTTQETLSNSETVKKWFLQSAGPEDIASHFVAVSTNIERVTAFGISADNIFPMWDWVGGRFSLWGAVGLSIALAVGYDNFDLLLQGANKMDVHFRTEPPEKNIPVILALISVWYNNFFGAETEAIIPYTQYLTRFAPYLQQGIMESNGKSVDRNGDTLGYQTGTVIWGEPGTNSQHAFFQLIHQGTKLIPTDFIGFCRPLHGEISHHNKLMSNFFAQTEALLNGKTGLQVRSEFTKLQYSTGEAAFLEPFKIFTGNKPTNTILIDKLTPEALGALIAIYEHKIFVQGVIWNIFSYDQWGVELGKQLASSILSEIESTELGQHDASTTSLLRHFKARQ